MKYEPLKRNRIRDMAKGHLFPKRTRDRVTFLLMLIGIPFGICFELFMVVPVYHDAYFCPIVIVHIIVTAFITANVTANLYWVITTDASGSDINLPYVLRPGWRYCHICQLNYPPRSYHCDDCKECVIKRDHHCMFTGCCVGHSNHRYYYIAVMYLWIGAIYGVSYSWNYIWEEIGGVNIITVLSLAAPHLALLLGYLDLYTFTMATLQCMACILILLSSYLFFYQTILIINGQTMYERRHNIRRWNLGWRRNFGDVLGKRWYATWIWPQIPSVLDGKGLEFRTAEDVQEDMAKIS